MFFSLPSQIAWGLNPQRMATAIERYVKSKQGLS
jgi:hypothetical protein